MDWREHVAIDLAVCHGQACIKGARIMVAVVLDNLAAGLEMDEYSPQLPLPDGGRCPGCLGLRRPNLPANGSSTWGHDL